VKRPVNENKRAIQSGEAPKYFGASPLVVWFSVQKTSAGCGISPQLFSSTKWFFHANCCHCVTLHAIIFRIFF